MRGAAPIMAVLLLVLVACGSGNTATQSGQESPEVIVSSGSPATVPPTGSALPSTGTVVTTGRSQFGEILFDGTGQAIYLFDKEKTAEPQCYNDCARAWPPVLTDGQPATSAGARMDRLGTTLRADGSVQVTYAGHPLYFYAHEGKNEVRCHNVRDFGGLWLVVTPAGDAAPH